MKTIINDDLRQLVQLEKLYPYQYKDGLEADGIPCAGMYLKKSGRILLNANLQEAPHRIIPVYLHEVAHLIAEKYNLNKSLDADAHNQYFAVLVAVMYRRANKLESLKIYDFCDSDIGQRVFFKNMPMLDDEVLIERFRYILRRSSALAKSRLTIEQIAQALYVKDALPHWQEGRFFAARAAYWPDVALGSFFGMSVLLCAGVSIALVLR